LPETELTRLPKGLNPETKQLIDEAIRIVESAKEKSVTLRIFGAAAIRHHCPNFGYLHEALGRKIGDIDFASYERYSSTIVEVMGESGFEEDVTVTAFGGGRLIFNRKSDGHHCDIFLDKLIMSHVLSFERRLEIDYPTIPLADLFLAKMQIFQLNEKDIIDTIILIREHAVGPSDNETINDSYISQLCSRDWGLWRTVTMNIGKVSSFLAVYTALSNTDRDDVKAKLDKLLHEIDVYPKNLAWRLRARVGEKKKWYNDVEELYR
jgi:hypothetical protein